MSKAGEIAEDILLEAGITIRWTVSARWLRPTVGCIS